MNRRRKLLLFGAPTFDPDALDYIQRVEAADEQALETEIKQAINVFFRGLKSDGIYDALKASCILAGARTLSGALIPLKNDMPAPTNFNFVSDDYNRLTLSGDGTKRLFSNRMNNDDPQNSKHISVYITRPHPFGVIGGYIGTITSGNSSLMARSGVQSNRNLLRINANDNFTFDDSDTIGAIGFRGLSRANENEIRYRTSSGEFILSQESRSPSETNIGIFARGDDDIADSDICFYSIGEDINMEKLENRLDTLFDAYANILS